MTAHCPVGRPACRLPRVYRAAVLLDEDRVLFTLQALTEARDAEDVRVESTKLKDCDIESQVVPSRRRAHRSQTD